MYTMNIKIKLLVPIAMTVFVMVIFFSSVLIAWEKKVGGQEADGAMAVCLDNDGNIVIVGYTTSEGAGKTDVYLVKTDPTGNTIWSHSYGTSERDQGNDLCVSADGGYAIVGYTTSTNSRSKDILLLIVSADGSEQWRKTFGGSEDDEGMAIVTTVDGGFLISGCSASSGAGEFDVYVLKTDAAGNEIWSKTFGGSESEWGNDIALRESGGYFITGATGSFGLGNRDVYLIALDENGNEEWNTTFGTTGYEWATACSETSDGGLIMIGQGDIHSIDLFQIYVVKADRNGTLEWSKKFGESSFYEYGQSIKQRADGQYIFCGSSRSVAHQNDLYYGILDQSGAIVTKNLIGSTANEWAADMIIDDNGSMIIVGFTNATDNGKSDLLIEKLE